MGLLGPFPPQPGPARSSSSSRRCSTRAGGCDTKAEGRSSDARGVAGTGRQWDVEQGGSWRRMGHRFGRRRPRQPTVELRRPATPRPINRPSIPDKEDTRRKEKGRGTEVTTLGHPLRDFRGPRARGFGSRLRRSRDQRERGHRSSRSPERLRGARVQGRPRRGELRGVPERLRGARRASLSPRERAPARSNQTQASSSPSLLAVVSTVANRPPAVAVIAPVQEKVKSP